MNLRNYNPRRLAMLAVVLAVCSAMLGSRIESAFSQDNEFQQIQKFQTVLSLIAHNYVDKVDQNKLTEAAIVGMLKQLDPHSIYMPPPTVKQNDEEFRGNFEGIGVSFGLNHDTILVENVITGGPSEKVGLLAGDKIIMINDRSTKGFTEDSVKNNLRGPKGTKVKVGVLRGTRTTPVDYVITRDVIPLHSVTASLMIDKTTGYIALSRFIETSHEEMLDALDTLTAQGMKSLILDLRGNPGGYMEQAVMIADEFIGGTKTIVYTKGRVSSNDEVDISHPGQAYEKLPLVVLVNNGSASASEILSGALQDLDRAPIVGETTFGKGLVQRQYRISDDGSAVRLTISRYYTPSGRSIQRPYDGGKYTKGIENADADDEDNFNHTADLNPKDSLRPKFKTAAGRTILGGGGITPDYIIRTDTMTHSTIEVFASSLIFDYAKDYVADNGESLHAKYTPDSYVKNFQISDDVINGILAKAREKKVKFDEKEIDQDRHFIKEWIRAEIGYQVFGYNVNARIHLPMDKQFQKAYSLLSEAKKMSEVFK